MNPKEDATICVVGKSPNILGKKMGELIDSHDIVARVNINPNSGNIYSHSSKKFHGKYSKEDYGSKTNHIHSHPYVAMRMALMRRKNLPLLLETLKNLKDPERPANSRKSLFIPVRDRSWWKYPANGQLSGVECGPFLVSSKRNNYKVLAKHCKDHDVHFEVRYFEEETRMLADMMVRFNPDDSKLGLSHGPMTGTETIMYYANRFKNVYIAGFTTDENKVVNIGSDSPQMEYDAFFLRQLIKIGMIKRLEDVA